MKVLGSVEVFRQDRYFLRLELRKRQGGESIKYGAFLVGDALTKTLQDWTQDKKVAETAYKAEVQHYEVKA